MNKLSDWRWAVDCSNSKGQTDQKIPPELFLSRSAAQRYNNITFPKGRVVQITIKEIKRK